MDFLAKGLWVRELPVQTHAASSPCSYGRGNERREPPRVGIKTVFISSFLFVTWSFSSKRKKTKTKLTTKNPAAPGVLHKCSFALQLVLVLATLNYSSKIRCSLSLRETAPCPAVDLPEGETSA